MRRPRIGAPAAARSSVACARRCKIFLRQRLLQAPGRPPPARAAIIGRLPAIEGLAERRMRFGTARSPTPISRRLSSISPQKWSKSACARCRAGIRAAAEPAQHQHDMQHDQVETAVDRIRHAQVRCRTGQLAPAPRSCHRSRRWCRSAEAGFLKWMNGQSMSGSASHAGDSQIERIAGALQSWLLPGYVNAAPDARRDRRRMTQDDDARRSARIRSPADWPPRFARAPRSGARALRSAAAAARPIRRGYILPAGRAGTDPARRPPGAGADRARHALDGRDRRAAKRSITSRRAPSARSPS